MSTRPKSQIVNIKPVAREFRGPLTPITLVPHQDNFEPNWLESWIADGGQEYALRDLRAKEGRCGVDKDAILTSHLYLLCYDKMAIEMGDNS